MTTTATPPLRYVPLATHLPGCRCAACAIEAALLLIGTGRVEMGVRLLEPLPATLREAGDVSAALAEARRDLAHVRAQADGQRLASGVLEREIACDHAGLRKVEAAIESTRRELARPSREVREARPDPGGRPMRNHQKLAEALAEGRITPERIATLLKVGPGDVAEIASGRVGLPTSAWRKVSAELGMAERRDREPRP